MGLLKGRLSPHRILGIRGQDEHKKDPASALHSYGNTLSKWVLRLGLSAVPSLFMGRMSAKIFFVRSSCFKEKHMMSLGSC